MIGIIITSHGQIAKELLETSKMFFGELQQVKACCLETDDNPDDFINVFFKRGRGMEANYCLSNFYIDYGCIRSYYFRLDKRII